MQIAPLTSEHLTEALALLEEAGLRSGAGFMRYYLRWQPDGYFGLFDGGRLVGTCGALRFGRIAFVGLMAVLPERQGQGLGARLLRWSMDEAAARGCDTFYLEATPAGRPLYEKFGYITTGVTQVLGWTPQALPPGSGSARPITPADLPALAAMDASLYGADRGGMMADVIVDASDARLVQGPQGEVLAWGVRNPIRLGPLLARDPSSAREVALALLEGAPAPLFVQLPGGNTDAMALLAELGFTPMRELYRMKIGPATLGGPQGIYALASAGMG